MSIRIGIVGYGNLGRGVECAIAQNPDMELVAVLTRRPPESVKILSQTATVYHIDDIENLVGKIDVMILCGGSATDLPHQTPMVAKLFSVVDSFDTHAKIPEHFANVDASAREGGNIAVISCGWDPGMFVCGIFGLFMQSISNYQKKRDKDDDGYRNDNSGCLRPSSSVRAFSVLYMPCTVVHILPLGVFFLLLLSLHFQPSSAKELPHRDVLEIMEFNLCVCVCVCVCMFVSLN